MKIQSTPQQSPPTPKQRMEDDPRFWDLLGRIGGSALTQFEMRRDSEGMFPFSYVDPDETDGLSEHEQLTLSEERRAEHLADRAWLFASILYRRLTRKSEVREFNKKLA
jgi:hypothetical protein